MEKEYGIKEITGKTHEKNKTRMFRTQNGDAFGVYDSGMVRKVFRNGWGDLTCYQLNKTYTQTSASMRLDDDGKFVVRKYNHKARIPIHPEITRLKYLLHYLIKNYDIKKLENTNNIKVVYDIVKPKEVTRETITVNGISYVRV
tara:strand:- start:65 stop:496 length:432 start_codon:yes stop_codon:yes gene_type:complete